MSTRTETYPTINLRFCRHSESDGNGLLRTRFTLQQEWVTRSYNDRVNPLTETHVNPDEVREWRDVPTVEDGT